MVDEKNIIESSLQKVKVSKRDRPISVLDVGGGGEGIIGLVYGKKTVAIDKLAEELAETNNQAVKIVMDACELAFPDNSFDLVTFFYSLMYMDAASKEKALAEAVRVLKKDGILEIWDTALPEYFEGEKEIFIASVSVDIGETTINTGYGVSIKDKYQTSQTIIYLIQKDNICLESVQSETDAFHIIARKLS